MRDRFHTKFRASVAAYDVIHRLYGIHIIAKSMTQSDQNQTKPNQTCTFD